MAIGDDALSSYAFHVEIDNVTLIQFKEVSGLKLEISVIEHQENKAKGIPINKPVPGVRKNNPVTLKRGITTDTGWWAWVKEVHDGKIDKARRNASIVLMDYDLTEKFRVNLLNCWPSALSISGLQAGGTEIAVEEVTLVHEGLELA
ncbi:phage tail protein [Cellulomonas sp. URHD0024]|uniref:phage tail protein n=1 Tax=Cellulomonas sp. URHD0024 TaxID=1302620 RepID=UPI000415BA47|nr:phage tail protein [Cellulomonas sp. URHD0024]